MLFAEELVLLGGLSRCGGDDRGNGFRDVP
ncbi:MAG: hypothetical protein KatS3mg111_3720 [Pirellulaceae bacterium]|nr:MAG: hypothetical protein KatS3mg111_3720 [Pirellulaceae bacterium]